MKRLKAAIRFAPAVLALAGLGLLGCSSDDPTSPTPTPQDPGDGTGTSATWNITLTADDDQLATSGEEATTTITVRVTNASTGARPPNGTTVAITVTNGLLANGQTSGFVELANGAAVFEFTATTEGTALIQAQLEGSVGRLRISVLEAGVFLLSHVEPNVGSPEGGEAVTIFGQGFVEPVRVVIGGLVAQVTSVSSSRVRVITPRSSSSVPVGETQPVTVTVTNAIGSEDEASDSLPNGFVYAHGGSFAEPQIFSVTPNTGPNEGGTEVVINGTGFQRPVQVLFGDRAGASVEAEVLSVTESRIRAISPPASAFGLDDFVNEQVDIIVVNLDSGFRAVAPGAFRYGVRVLITSIGPSEGPISGGQLVTLFGQGFDEPVAVELGLEAQQVISVTGTEIVVRTVPVDIDECRDQVGEGALVTNIETGDSNEDDRGPAYTYKVRRPLITGIDPSSGPQGGGIDVTISGSGFSDPARVTFGGQTSPATSVGPEGETVTAELPSFPTAELETEDCDDNADGTTGQRYLPTSVEVTVTNLATGCDNDVSDFFTYNPADTTCRNDVGPVEEEPVECEDGFDNDGDGLIDEEDPECTGPDDDDESA